MESSLDKMREALAEVQANVAESMEALLPGVMQAAEDAARQDFERRAALLLASIQAQLEAAKAARMLGVASSDIAGLVVVPVIVEPGKGQSYHQRNRNPQNPGVFHVAEAAHGVPVFAVCLAPGSGGPFGQYAPFEEALRRGLPPGKYRFVGALVREEAGAGEGSAS
jgi:hypothetical protein